MAEQELPPCPYHSDKQCRDECQFTPPYFCWWDEELGTTPDDPEEASDG